jgi:hypothetical protein
VAFVAGLAVGVVVSRLTTGRTTSAEPVMPAAVIEPEPAAPAEPAAAAAEPAEKAEPAAEETEPEEAEPEVPVAEPENRAAAVDDVVAELERRVRGRRTDGEADGTTGGRRGKGG